MDVSVKSKEVPIFRRRQKLETEKNRTDSCSASIPTCASTKRYDSTVKHATDNQPKSERTRKQHASTRPKKADTTDREPPSPPLRTSQTFLGEASPRPRSRFSSEAFVGARTTSSAVRGAKIPHHLTNTNHSEGEQTGKRARKQPRGVIKAVREDNQWAVSPQP